MCESVNTQVKKPIEIMKKNTTNEIATVKTTNAIATIENKTNAIVTTENNEKTNATLTHDIIMNTYTKYGISCNHDTSGYCGIDNGKNNTIIFSPNYKVKQTNIYCNETVYNTLKTLKYENTELCDKSNTSSKTIPYTIICKSVNDFEKMVEKLKNEVQVRLIQTMI